jgi:hypothetical protein
MMAAKPAIADPLGELFAESDEVAAGLAHLERGPPLWGRRAPPCLRTAMGRPREARWLDAAAALRLGSRRAARTGRAHGRRVSGRPAEPSSG